MSDVATEKLKLFSVKVFVLVEAEDEEEAAQVVESDLRSISVKEVAVEEVREEPTP